MAEKIVAISELKIFTDSKNILWLQYLMDEFCRIERAKFTIKVYEFNEKYYDRKNVLLYLRNSFSDIYYCNHESCIIDKNTSFIDVNGFQIIEGSSSKEKYKMHYDLFWNAFYILSRKHEYDIFSKNSNIRSYSNKTKINCNYKWEIPHVNLMFIELKKFLVDNFHNLSFLLGKNPILELSHDLDYINKTPALLLKQSVFNFYNALINVSSKKFIDSIKFIVTKSDYWNFDFWMDLENHYNKKSTFYVYSRVNNGIKELILDPSYSVYKNMKLKEKLIDMHNYGWQIGLHGSYFSHSNYGLLKDEHDLLQNTLNLEIKKNRQHWLCYNEKVTPFIHEKLFEIDSTLGWNDRIGFRAGIASRYRPYNHRDNKPFKHFEIPQVVMDSNIYDYGSSKSAQIISEAARLLDKCKEIKNTEISISWHPRTSSKDYNWSNGYEYLLKKYFNESRI